MAIVSEKPKAKSQHNKSKQKFVISVIFIIFFLFFGFHWNLVMWMLPFNCYRQFYSFVDYLSYSFEKQKKKKKQKRKRKFNCHFVEFVLLAVVKFTIFIHSYHGWCVAVIWSYRIAYRIPYDPCFFQLTLWHSSTWLKIQLEQQTRINHFDITETVPFPFNAFPPKNYYLFSDIFMTHRRQSTVHRVKWIKVGNDRKSKWKRKKTAKQKVKSGGRKKKGIEKISSVSMQ